MGFPMAGHLAKAGHEVTVYNRTRAKAEGWVAKHGGRLAATPAEAAAGALVFSCVGDDPDLRAVTLGPDGSFQATAQGAVHVDHTTASAASRGSSRPKRRSAASPFSTDRSRAASPAPRTARSR